MSETQSVDSPTVEQALRVAEDYKALLSERQGLDATYDELIQKLEDQIFTLHAINEAQRRRIQQLEDLLAQRISLELDALKESHDE